MNKVFAQHFAAEWVEAWNSHQLDRILSHYTDDFCIETPMALKLFPESQGVISGKDLVRQYWTLGLEKIPDLHFEILDVLAGVNSLAIYYINTATNKKSVELMSFNDQLKVNKAVVCYTE